MIRRSQQEVEQRASRSRRDVSGGYYNESAAKEEDSRETRSRYAKSGSNYSPLRARGEETKQNTQNRVAYKSSYGTSKREEREGRSFAKTAATEYEPKERFQSGPQEYEMSRQSEFRQS